MAESDLAIETSGDCIPGMQSQTAALSSVALVHDWLTGMRGGEKVLDALCRMFPDAPLWTLLYNQGTVSERIAKRVIHQSFLQHCPFAKNKYRSYLPLFPLFAETNKAHATIVISTSHAVAKSMVRRGKSEKQLHICYLHTPMRYAWDLFDEYFGASRVGIVASKFIYKPIIRMLQLYDIWTLDRVDLFVANSSYVAERVKRIYGRDAAVLPPPVDISRFADTERKPEDWYLIVSALVPYKRVEHGIEACAKLGRKLKIIGSGPEMKKLRRIAEEMKAEVDFLGFVPDDILTDYYCRAKALLFPGIEDFGIVPVESIAAGCPVLAYAKGGILDSMNERTAVFYTEQSARGLMGAMQDFEIRQGEFSASELRRHAQSFSEESFLRSFEKILLQAIASRKPLRAALD